MVKTPASVMYTNVHTWEHELTQIARLPRFCGLFLQMVSPCFPEKEQKTELERIFEQNIIEAIWTKKGVPYNLLYSI